MNIRRSLTNIVDNFEDLKIWNAGARNSVFNKYGPVIRDHYFILHIVQGRGVLRIRNQTYPLEPGQGCIIPPETVHRYETEGSESWTYFWFSFHGLKAEQLIKKAKLSYDNPVFTIEDKQNIYYALRKLKEAGLLNDKQLYSEVTELKVLALLYFYFAELIEAAEDAGEYARTELHRELYVKKAVQFIEINFFKKITIADVADSVGLNASYLGHLFKKQMMVTPQQYLCRFRIEKAIQYMHNPSVSIKEISQSVGYEDPYLFSRMFRQIKRMPPSEYRKNLNKEGP
jgi:AraC-like DNA-binding protein